MYCDHVPSIAGYMLASEDNFARGALFALLSIQQQFVTVPNQLRDVEARGEQSAFLFGSKLGAYRYIMRHKRDLWDAARGDDTASALRAMTAIPGIGIVKGAFILQLCGHDVACLDSQNIEREGRNPREYATNGVKSGKAFDRKLNRYLAETGGKARHYWDTWCEYVGAKYKLSAEACSAIHLAIVTQECGALAVPRGILPSIEAIPF